MNRWKAVAILLTVASIFWFILGLGVITYSLAHDITTWPITWFIVFGAPCSIAWYVSYRCIKKSQVPVEGIPTRPSELPSIEQKGPIHKTEPQQGMTKARAELKTEVKPLEKPTAALTGLEATIQYYKKRRNRSAILSALGAFWVLIISYGPFDWPPQFLYSYLLAFLGAIYFFLNFLYSGFRVIGLKRTHKRSLF